MIPSEDPSSFLCHAMTLPRRWVTSQKIAAKETTILVKISGIFRPLLPSHFNDAKMAGFGFRAHSSLLWGEGVSVPFYSVQDCRLFASVL